jgi:modulator of FtsH protease HflC
MKISLRHSEQRQMAKWKLRTIALPIVFGLLYATFFVVNERDQVAVLRFGEIVEVRSDPGLYFKLPFFFLGADRIYRFEDRILRYDLPEIRLQVSGGKFYDVSAFVIYRIEDAGRLLEKVAGDLEVAHQRLQTRLDSALRKVYGLKGFESALSIDRGVMMDEVRNELKPAAAQLGLVIEDVRIERTELTEQVRNPTFERMKAERFAAAELIRARGREAAQRLRAVADRHVVEILATAQRDAQTSRGEGEGRRAEIFSKAHSRAPEFYAFYRSMDAYEKALSGPATTLILSPESQFFKYFASPGKR